MRLFHKLSAGFLVLAAQTYISYHTVRGLPISYNNFPSLTLPYLPYLSITYHALQYLTMPHHTYASEAARCPAEQRLEQLMLGKRNSKSNWKPNCNHEMTFALIFNFVGCSSFSACFAAAAPVAPLPSISSMVKPAGHVSRGRGFGGGSLSPFRGHHGHAFILERVHKQNVFAICTQRKICAPTFSHSPFFRAEKKKTLSQSVHLNVFWGGSVRFGHFGRIPLVPNPFCSKKHQKDRPSFRLSSSPLSPSRLAVWSALWHSENRYDIKTYVGLDILSSYYW